MIYLDNAATSFPKPESVYSAAIKCMREFCANPGRGGHWYSLMSGRAVLEAREMVSKLFNIKNPLQLCFTKNATEAINLAIRGILKPGSHVITSCMEHNSVMRPLMALKKELGIEISIVGGDALGRTDANDFKRNIKKNTDLIVCTLSSNVNGITMPVNDIGTISAKYEIPFLIDASQGAGSISIDVESINADMLAFPGHKGLYGLQGTGGLYVKEGLRLKPVITGGTGSNSESIFQPEFMPDYLESGTLNTPGIVSLGEGARFIAETGITKIEKHKSKLIKRLCDGLEEIKGVIFYNSRRIEENSGIVAINIKGMDSTEVSAVLDKDFGIATRAGLHCSPSAHKVLGTGMVGIVRFSPGYFNSMEEIDNTIEAIKIISRKYANL